jgi:hypothetical protein
MGNPAEKNDPQPESETILSQTAYTSQQKILFYRKIFFGLAKSIGIWPVKTVYTHCICSKH